MTSTITTRHQQKKRIVRNTAANTGAQVATMLSTLILLPLLVRSFGLSTYGTLALAASVTSYALLLDFGFSATLTRLVAERSAKGDAEGTVRAVLTAGALYAALGVVVATVLFLLGSIAGIVFNLTPAEASLLKTLLWIGAAASLWQWPALAARDTLAGMQRYDLIAMVTLGIVAADIAGTLYVLRAGEGPVVLAVIRVAAMLVASSVSVVLAARLLPLDARSGLVSRTDARDIVRSGSSIFALQIAGVMSRQQADKLIIGIFVGAAAVTMYEIAAKLNSLVTTLTNLTVSAVLPVAAEINATDDQVALRSLFLRGTKIIASFVAPITTIMIVLAIPFISVWFGPGYEEAALLAQLLLGSQLLLPLYQLGDQVLIAKDRFSIWVRGGMSLAVLNVGLSVVLVQSYGAVGVTVATLVACLLEFPWYLRVFSREMRLPVREWLSRTAWPAYLLLLIPAVVGAAGIARGLAFSWAGLIATVAVGLLGYWVAVARLGYTKAERAELTALLPMRSRLGTR